MTRDNPKSNIYSIRERESDRRESAALDDALNDAVQGIAQSLRRDEIRLREKRNFRVIVTFMLLLIAVFSLLLLDFYMSAETVENQAIENPSKPSASPAPSADSTDTPEDTSVETSEETLEETPDETVLTTGDFLMKLPRGFEWEVRIIALGEGRYRMISKRNLNMLGIYEQQENRLVMIKPDDQRLTEFQWVITNNDHLELIEEPPARKTGATYLGTALTRKPVLE